MRKDIESCVAAIRQKIKGKDEQIQLALVCLLAKGHLLLEDLPGMGKTTLSQCLASVLSMDYARVQFTSDLLPADMLGVNIYEPDTHQFSFHPGPIFHQVLLADEINRASPKTQSALLEAMAESQVTIDGNSYELPTPFFVIATQNPLFQSGTYPLPESQIDRFTMKLSLGFPDFAAEKSMLLNDDDKLITKSVIDTAQLLDLQKQVSAVVVSEAVVDYILALVNATRNNQEFPNALSPRASKAIYHCAQAFAFIHDRNYVIPEDVQMIFPSVTEHRLRGQDQYAQTANLLSAQLLKKVDPIAA
ncbi:AAA family ATPase [Brumicola nitratireducens]|uniref:MoxR protein n=1 Tax=Glaciecola nitratireducens (strain JCM 12485 / KCTC 12276 / FR1064) TaxID=1085623 RepID=G4QHB3_GLANF|nr:AAA family ATPase [Glaciecola nitratireducens]AEP29744.1 MoxR protein [Glaciecola nitratireducens FR1064]